MSPETSLPADPLLARWDALCAADPQAPLLWEAAQPCSRQELERAAQTAAAALPEEACSGQIWGLQAADARSFLAGLLALWRRGAVVLFLDADLPVVRSKVLCAELGGAGLLEGSGPEAGLRAVPVAGTRARLPGFAALKLSSGSSGAPRGVLMRAEALAADAAAVEAAMGIGAADRVVAAVPLSFSYGLGNLVLPALLAGRELVLPRPGLPTDILAAARRHQATVLPTVPFFLESLLRREGELQLPPSLRLVVSAGAALQPATAAAFLARCGQQVHAFYGASEVGGICYDASGAAALQGLVGSPLPGVEVELRGPEGLVAVRSKALYSGYWTGAELPPAPEWYESADFARQEAQGLRLCGRRSHLLNLGGYKLDPRQVAAVIETLVGVRSVHVAALEIPGRELPSCCALVEADAVALARETVLEHCRQHLPARQRPRRLVVVDEIPRNGRGKVEAATVERLLRAE